MTWKSRRIKPVRFRTRSESPSSYSREFTLLRMAKPSESKIKGTWWTDDEDILEEYDDEDRVRRTLTVTIPASKIIEEPQIRGIAETLDIDVEDNDPVEWMRHRSLRDELRSKGFVLARYSDLSPNAVEHETFYFLADPDEA